MFSGSTVPPDSEKTDLGSSNQEASPSAGKNNGIVLVPCHAWECISSGVDIFRGPWVSFTTTDELSARVTKITSRISVS